MKSFRYIFLILSVVLAVGCDPRKHDEAVIENLDPTRPGYVLFAESLKGVCAASGGLISALNFNEWLNAPDEQSRWKLEDEYYLYRKIREREENLWDIYDNYSSERYLLHEGLTLGEEGAVWEMQMNPTFFYAEEADEVPTITRVAEDRFELDFSYVPVNVAMNSNRPLISYLNSWGNSKRAHLSANFTIATNNSEFRSGEADNLQCIITGEGKLWDKSNNYSVDFEITEPLRIIFSNGGFFSGVATPMGKLHIFNSLGDWADVDMTGYNTIAIEYYRRGVGMNEGFYSWSGASITPR